MIDRLEVTPGAGTVIRFGHVAAWVGPEASTALLSFLTESARNLAFSPSGGQQLTDHLAGVLATRDPEPRVPFAVIGPSSDGWATLLHGPVQGWDGLRWTVPSSHPGWVKVTVWPQPSISVTPAGAPAQTVAPDSVWNLEAGVVPGGGMIVVPAFRSPLVAVPSFEEPVVAPAARPEDEPTAVVGPVGSASQTTAGQTIAGQTEDQTAVIPVAGAEATGLLDVGEQGGADQGVAGSGGEVPGQGPDDKPDVPEPNVPEPAPSEPAPSEPGPLGPVIDLRSTRLPAGRVTYPPLPADGGPAAPVAGAPVVAGVVCQRGHLNRPEMTSCTRCRSPLRSDGSYTVSGTRPALGCLIVDDGAVYRLDSGYLAGSEPSSDPTVRGRLARPLVLVGEDVAPSHAEIRLHDWDVVVTDRAAPGGTFVFEPESTAWERLRAYEPRVLKPGTHVAIGQRVVTFVTPWLPGPG